MRSSGGTNFGLARSVVSRTKTRIACLADLSFHDGNGPLEAVSADAETNKGGADKAGSNANVVSRVRRSMPERGMFLFTFNDSCFIRRDRFVPILLETSFWRGNGNASVRLQPVRLSDAMVPLPLCPSPTPATGQRVINCEFFEMPEAQTADDGILDGRDVGIDLVSTERRAHHRPSGATALRLTDELGDGLGNVMSLRSVLTLQH